MNELINDIRWLACALLFICAICDANDDLGAYTACRYSYDGTGNRTEKDCDGQKNPLRLQQPGPAHRRTNGHRPQNHLPLGRPGQPARKEHPIGHHPLRMEQRQPATQSQRRQHQHPLRLRRARPAHQPHPGGRRPKTRNAMDPGHRPPLQRNRAGEEPPKRRRMARNALHAHPRWRGTTHQRTKTRQNAARL